MLRRGTDHTMPLPVSPCGQFVVSFRNWSCFVHIPFDQSMSHSLVGLIACLLCMLSGTAGGSSRHTNGGNFIALPACLLCMLSGIGGGMLLPTRCSSEQGACWPPFTIQGGWLETCRCAQRCRCCCCCCRRSCAAAAVAPACVVACAPPAEVWPHCAAPCCPEGPPASGAGTAAGRGRRGRARQGTFTDSVLTVMCYRLQSFSPPSAGLLRA